jgi:hypothetical protein
MGWCRGVPGTFRALWVRGLLHFRRQLGCWSVHELRTAQQDRSRSRAAVAPEATCVNPLSTIPRGRVHGRQIHVIAPCGGAGVAAQAVSTRLPSASEASTNEVATDPPASSPS